ncbi:MAG: hypothetical protein ACYDAC_11500 [Candidatus Dormibacteria bacterium]
MRKGIQVFVGLVSVLALSLTVSGGAVRAATAHALPYAVPSGPVAAGPTNNLDCNGWGQGNTMATPGMRPRCVDPIAAVSYYGYPAHGRFYDNGHYVGHDEPSVKFISTAAGSGYQMTYFQQLPVDPTGPPSTSHTGATTSIYNELSPAPWYGLPICDSNSYPTTGGLSPQSHPCTPLSDSNAPTSTSPGGGAAFMELQFYPPGNGPWVDAPSIDQSKWGVALTIDSAEYTIEQVSGNGLSLVPNPKCTEPVNVAFLTHDGVPMGPPSPQQFNDASQVETADTLLLNPGDTVETQFTDVADPSGTQGTTADTGGLKVTVTDVTTGVSGFVVASAANGFMNTDPTSCNGSAYSFHALYNTASQGNQVSWAALDGGVLMEQEIGHFEACASLSNADPVVINYGNGDTFTDSSISQTCNGGFENAGSGEGPCANTGGVVCSNGSSEGDVACSTGSGPSNCESSDGFCFPAGQRTVSFTGTVSGNQTWTAAVAGCTQNRYQNGDLDYDGNDYVPDWPDRADTSNGHPTSFQYLGPFDANGNAYPTTQFETDVGLEEANCDPSTGSGCTAPPAPAASNPAPFYPFWSITNASSLKGVTLPSNSCIWNFGNDIKSVTVKDFGQDGQYGTGNGTQTKATLISSPASNPQISGTCTPLTLSSVVVAPAVGTPEVPLLPLLAVPALGIVAATGIRRRRGARS